MENMARRKFHDFRTKITNMVELEPEKCEKCEK